MIGRERGIYLREWVTETKFTGSETAKKRKLIALSFDDGPHHYNTPKVIEILNKNEIQGTFFWIVSYAVNLSNSHPALFQQIVLEIKKNKHEIGLHAPNDFKPTFSSRIFGHFTKEELQKAKETLQNLTAMSIFLYRPHCIQLGSSIVYAKQLGMTTVMGDVFRSVKPSEPIRTQVKKLNQAKAGSILILHDGISVAKQANHILDVLPESIRLIKSRGLELTSVSNVLQN